MTVETMALPMSICETSGQWVAVKGVYGRNVKWVNEALGLTIRHCGHPTALYPYYIEERQDLGKFAHLADAKAIAKTKRGA